MQCVLRGNSGRCISKVVKLANQGKNYRTAKLIHLNRSPLLDSLVLRYLPTQTGIRWSSFVSQPAPIMAAAATAGQTPTVKVWTGGRTLQLDINENSKLSFHSVWLRHQCRCESCIQPYSGARLTNPGKLKPSYTLSSASILDGHLHCKWLEEPEHNGKLPLDFLVKHDYSESSRQRQSEGRDTLYHTDGLAVISYADVQEGKAGLWRWLQLLDERGVCLVRGVPTDKGTVRKLAELIYPIQRTIYDEVFDVESTPQPINVAYSSAELGFHTDLAYYESPPGLQFLHCIRFDDCVVGGESILADAFLAAEQLRNLHPQHFQTLLRVPATFQKIHYQRERPVHMVYQRPHIVTNGEGKIIAVTWAPYFEGPLSVPEDDVEAYYAAYHAYAQILENKEIQMETRMKPGEVLVMNNRRFLHARNGFQLNGGVRHLQGCYVNIDEFRSQIQVLSREVADGRMARRLGNNCWL